MSNETDAAFDKAVAGEFVFAKDAPEQFALEKGILSPGSLKLAKEGLNKCFNEICEIVRYYMDMPEDQIKIIGVWIIGTYFHDSFNTYPFLFLNAMRGSGKTRLLKIISHLSKGGRGQVQTGVSESVLFRKGTGVTMVIDECENIGSKERSTFREYLNACYKKGGIVERMKKARFKGEDEWIIETLKPYKPIAMANIWGMEEVLEDRCITLILEKSNNAMITKKIEDFEDNQQFLLLKRKLGVFSVVSDKILKNKQYEKSWNSYIDSIYNNIYNTHTHTTHTPHTTEDKVQYLLFEKINKLDVDGRNFELLFPLLILADLLDPKILEDVLKIGKNIMQGKKQAEFAESRDVMVYEFVSSQDQTLSLTAIKELTRKFKVFVGEEEWINEKWMGRALKRLNLIIDSERYASGRFVRLNVVKAQEKTKIWKTKK